MTTNEAITFCETHDWIDYQAIQVLVAALKKFQSECDANQVTEKEREDLPRLFRWQSESLASFRDKFSAKSNCEALDAIDVLKEGEKWAASMFCEIMVTAISGMSDMLIVSLQNMGPQHALAAVKQLAEFAKEARADTDRLDALEKIIKDNRGVSISGPSTSEPFWMKMVVFHKRGHFKTPPSIRAIIDAARATP